MHRSIPPSSRVQGPGGTSRRPNQTLQSALDSIHVCALRVRRHAHRLGLPPYGWSPRSPGRERIQDWFDQAQRKIDLALGNVGDGAMAANGIGPHHDKEVRESRDAGAEVGRG